MDGEFQRSVLESLGEIKADVKCIKKVTNDHETRITINELRLRTVRGYFKYIWVLLASTFGYLVQDFFKKGPLP